MVLAYLRGLLKPKLHFGFRSLLSENVVLEALAAESMHDSLLRDVDFDLAALPILEHKAKKDTIQRTSARLRRVSELRSMDIYRVEQQLGHYEKLSNASNEISLLQLFRLAEKHGVFEKLDSAKEQNRD